MDSKLKTNVFVSARVIRADGSIEDLGVIINKWKWRFLMFKKKLKNIIGGKVNG